MTTSRARILVGLGSIVLVVAATACGQARVEGTTSSVPVTTSEPAKPTTTTSEPSLTTVTSVNREMAPPLLVVGDWGSGDLPEGAVAGAMSRFAEDHDIAAILTTGDNLYSDDADFLMAPYGWVAQDAIPWWVTWGNHDVETAARIDLVDETFDDPPRWTVHRWGDVDVIILDSNQVTSFEQAGFFLDAMAESDNPTIVVLHHPPYSCSHYGSTVDVVNAWIDILDDDVVLVLSGHEHSYQRFENDGVAYVVTGGGGQTIRPLSECPPNHPDRLAGAELYHFVTLEQTVSSIELRALDVNGEVIDQVTIPLP